MKIIKSTIDTAGKHRQWVEVTPGELVMLKYTKKPNKTLVIEDAQKHLDTEVVEKEKKIRRLKREEEIISLLEKDELTNRQ